jgi:hypothetical protein
MCYVHWKRLLDIWRDRATASLYLRSPTFDTLVMFIIPCLDDYCRTSMYLPDRLLDIVMDELSIFYVTQRRVGKPFKTSQVYAAMVTSKAARSRVLLAVPFATISD